MGDAQPLRTSQSQLSSAEICRARSWGPGTILEADGDQGRLVCYEITGFGLRGVFALQRSASDSESQWVANPESEIVLELNHRDWHAVR